MEKRLHAVEETLREQVLCDAAGEANAEVERITGELRAWHEIQQGTVAESRRNLDARLSSLRELEAEIERVRRALEQAQPDTRDHLAVAAYNQRVNECNGLVASHKELASQCSASVDAYNKRVAAHNQEAEARQREAERLRAKVMQRFESRRAWHEGRGEERLWREMNTLYAEALRRQRRAPTQEIDEQTRRLRAARWAMGSHVMRANGEARNNVLIVPARLCRSEHCFFVMDTGASLVTLTPELVEALGLAGCVGEELDVSLPGGLRTKGPRLTIPSILVEGVEATGVDAVMLDAPIAGADGLLGMSFLSRFEIALSDEQPRRLRLQPRDAGTPAPAPPDVAILWDDAADRWWADIVADALTVMGYRPRQAGGTRHAEDQFWPGVRCLILVVGSDPKASSTRYTNARVAFAKHLGCPVEDAPIICALGHSADAESLPEVLRNYSTVSISTLSWRDLLGSHVRVWSGSGAA